MRINTNGLWLPVVLVGHYGKGRGFSLAEGISRNLFVGQYHTAGSIFKDKLEEEVITASGIRNGGNIHMDLIGASDRGKLEVLVDFVIGHLGLNGCKTLTCRRSLVHRFPCAVVNEIQSFAGGGVCQVSCFAYFGYQVSNIYVSVFGDYSEGIVPNILLLVGVQVGTTKRVVYLVINVFYLVYAHRFKLVRFILVAQGYCHR